LRRFSLLQRHTQWHRRRACNWSASHPSQSTRSGGRP
jgi:hypothetical protein